MTPALRYLAIIILSGSLGVALGHSLATRPAAPVYFDFFGHAIPWDLSRHPDLAFEARDVREFLDAIIALEDAVPTSQRAPGCDYSRLANRYIAASRARIDISLHKQDPELLGRVHQLQAALEAYSDAFYQAADEHYLSSSGMYRHVRMDLTLIERLIREHVLQAACPKVSPLEKPHTYLLGFEERIQRSDWQETDEDDRLHQHEVFAYDGQENLIVALPPLREALLLFHPSLSSAIESQLYSWLEDYLPEANRHSPPDPPPPTPVAAQGP